MTELHQLLYPSDFPEINAIYFDHENETSLKEDLFERCHEKSEQVPQVAGLVGPQVAAVGGEDSSMPQEFFTAIEAEKMGDVNWDMRPHFYDKLSKAHLLLDSGAAVSAWPPDPGDVPDPNLFLRAVNGAKLRCYGYKQVDIQINRKRYPMKVIKTEVTQPVMGWDFQKKHRLTVDWTEYGDAVLIDRRNGISSILKYPLST